MSLHNGQPLSSHDLLYLWERVFGEGKLLIFFMHSERNQVEYSQNRARKFFVKVETLARCSEIRLSSVKLCRVWKFFYFSEPNWLACKIKAL